MPFFSCMLNVYLEIACNTKKEASDLNRDRQKAYRKLNNPKPLEEGEIAFETPSGFRVQMDQGYEKTVTNMDIEIIIPLGMKWIQDKETHKY